MCTSVKIQIRLTHKKNRNNIHNFDKIFYAYTHIIHMAHVSKFDTCASKTVACTIPTNTHADDNSRLHMHDLAKPNQPSEYVHHLIIDNKEILQSTYIFRL